MARQVVWTPRAKSDLLHIIIYLEEVWSVKDAVAFSKTLNDCITSISENPYIFRPSIKSGIREALVTKHNLIFFKYSETQIDILFIWDTRQHPRKLKRHLRKL
jgi:plasmid stabilization system protein ParE